MYLDTQNIFLPLRIEYNFYFNLEMRIELKYCIANHSCIDLMGLEMYVEGSFNF